MPLTHTPAHTPHLRVTEIRTRAPDTDVNFPSVAWAGWYDIFQAGK